MSTKDFVIKVFVKKSATAVTTIKIICKQNTQSDKTAVCEHKLKNKTIKNFVITIVLNCFGNYNLSMLTSICVYKCKYVHGMYYISLYPIEMHIQLFDSDMYASLKASH
ncbi:unnamed protein product [Ceratitis capitata]|uniref:(Mediterranean fruit fly) hypothetical protein n=1 Tax=Ceratitis capitata TaxID=7213 RepID=A0A811VAL2_CERCA|nr:unnamed protein product [Ceratitis capitata]